jgi:hypothetical protein
MSAARRPPDDPRNDIPKTHTVGGVCASPWCYNERWIQSVPGDEIDGVKADGRLRRYCRPCCRMLDAAILAAGGGVVVRLDDYR